VLNALAEALQLTDIERDYLGNLGTPAWPRPRLCPGTVRPELQLLVDSARGVPAYVIGPLCDVLAWNRLACAMFTDFSAIPVDRRTWSHLLFLHEDIPSMFDDWPRAAAENVAVVRMQMSRYPTDPALNALLDEMLTKSEAFRNEWAKHQVAIKGHSDYLFVHPVVGRMQLHFQALALPDDPGQHLVTYTAEPGSSAACGLADLAGIAGEMPLASDAA
jgi:hypothetical protein